MKEKLTLPTEEFEYQFSRSSGPGGQKVNKSNTRVTLLWNLTATKFIHQEWKKRFLKKYKKYCIEGTVQIHSQEHRTQKLNIEDCVKKLEAMLIETKYPPKKRKATKPSFSSVQKRLDSKNKRSKVKRMRSEKIKV